MVISISVCAISASVVTQRNNKKITKVSAGKVNHDMISAATMTGDVLLQNVGSTVNTYKLTCSVYAIRILIFFFLGLYMAKLLPKMLSSCTF